MNYESKLGKRLADLSSSAYAQGIKAQCVWYVRGRAKEKCGTDTGIIGNANIWYESAKAKGLKLSSEPISNSIACFNSGRYGHVIFIECTDGNWVYYTEANADADNRLSSDDGALKRQTAAEFKARKGYQGCICIGDTSERSESGMHGFAAGRDYTLTVNLKVRSGAGTDKPQKKRSELTADGKRHSLDKTYAVLKAGTAVTVKEVKAVGDDVWGRIPSGWIALYFLGDSFVK